MPHFFPIYKEDDRSAVSNYRPISFTSVVCKQLEHVIAGYLRQTWDKNDWVYEGKNGFRLKYSCENQVITECHDIANSLDEGIGIDAIIIDLSKGFHFIPHDRVRTKLAAWDVDSNVVVWVSRTQCFSVGRQLLKEITEIHV